MGLFREDKKAILEPPKLTTILGNKIYEALRDSGDLCEAMIAKNLGAKLDQKITTALVVEVKNEFKRIKAEMDGYSSRKTESVAKKEIVSSKLQSTKVFDNIVKKATDTGTWRAYCATKKVNEI